MLKDVGMKDSFLTPEDTAKVMRQLIWMEFECSRMAAGWMPALADYEAKTKLGRFAHVHIKHAISLRDRVVEVHGSFNENERTPEVIREMFERFSTAGDSEGFIAAYQFMSGKIYELYDQFYQTLDPILDAPTIDVLNTVKLERDEMSKWCKQALQHAHSDNSSSRASFMEWKAYLQEVWNLLYFGKEGAWPQHPIAEPAGPVPERVAMDPEFPLWNPEVKKPRKNYSDTRLSPLHDSIKQMHYINATEIGAAEGLAYVYYGVRNMPLDFYSDLARHMWDEVRHSQMGVRRLEQMGYKTEQFKFFDGSPGKDPKREWFPEMYANLTMVAEPCSFLKKRKAAEHFWKYGDVLSALHCEYDMVDERMHVDFGKKWGPELYKQIDDVITAQEMAERAKIRRLEQLGEVPKEQIRQVVKNFPAFCGLSTVELNYENY